MAKNVVISLSGGMDSSTLLLRCLSEYDKVTAVSFDYGQKHNVELERAKSLVEYLAQDPDISLKLRHEVITLGGLSSLLNSALVTGGDDVPEGHYEEDNMKATVVPNRNKIFASLVQAVALSEANANGNDTDIALGIHAGDHAIYPDCRQEFRDADDNAFRLGNWEADKVGYFTPYLDTDKLGILKDGQELVKELGFEFNEVYKRTNTSYKPIYFVPGEGIKVGIKGLYSKDGSEIGAWYSDYKSASSVERIEAFIKLGRPDPVEYADETGPVDYSVAKTHVEKLLAEHAA